MLVAEVYIYWWLRCVYWWLWSALVAEVCFVAEVCIGG